MSDPFSEMDPQVLMELLKSGVTVGQAMDQMQQQSAKATRMRGMGQDAFKSGQGMDLNNGRTFVKGHPLSMLAGVGGEIMGNMAENKANASQGNVRELQGAQFQKMLEAMMRQKTVGGLPEFEV